MNVLITRAHLSSAVWRATLLISLTTAACQSAAAQSTTAPASTPITAGATAPQAINVPELGVDTTLDKRAAEVSSHLRCPVCQGESIQDSPAELSAQMRTLVREQLVSGRTDAEIYDYFVQKYGQWILLEPKAEGINLLVYWLPIVFLIVGAIGIGIVIKKWTRPGADARAAMAETASEMPIE